MKDWKGNEISIGDVVVKILIKGMFDECRAALVMCKNNECTELVNWVNPRQYLWVANGRYKVVDGNTTKLSWDKNELNEVPFRSIDFWLNPKPWEILCIEGISDRIEEYYAKEWGL